MNLAFAVAPETIDTVPNNSVTYANQYGRACYISDTFLGRTISYVFTSYTGAATSFYYKSTSNPGWIGSFQTVRNTPLGAGQIAISCNTSGADPQPFKYVAGADSITDAHFYYREGTLDTYGVLTWTTSEQAVSTTYPDDKLSESIVVDSNGKVWVMVTTHDGTSYHNEIYQKVSGVWTKKADISPTGKGQLIALGGGKLAFVYGCTSGCSLFYIYYDGTAWSTTPSVTAKTDFAFSKGNIARQASGSNTIIAAYSDIHDKVFYLEVPYAGSWTTPVSIGNGGTSSLSVDALTGVKAIVYAGSNTVRWKYNCGTSWSSEMIISSSENAASNIVTLLPQTYSTSATPGDIYWTAGNSPGPYQIRHSFQSNAC